MKRCNKCGVEKPLDIYHFGQNKTSGKWESQCRECRAAYLRAYRKTEKGREVARLWRQKNTRRYVRVHRRKKPSYPYNLTKKQMLVLQYICRGFTNEEIAEQMGVNYSTVRSHLYQIALKMSVKGKVQIVLRALKENIVRLE